MLGAVGGDAKSALEVLESVGDADRARVTELLSDADYCDVSLVEGVPNLYIKVTATAGGHTAVVEITDHHTNVTCHTLDGIPVCGKSAGECAACAERVVAERAADTPMSIESIIDFIEDGDIEGARVVGSELAKMIVDEWLDAEFEGGRHERRVNLLNEIDQTRGLKVVDEA